jgi:hypothetical protein
MKKLIYTILASSFLLSCSSDSANDNSNNPSSTGMLVKTITSDGVTTTINYNGNKVINASSTNGQNNTYTYNGNLLTQAEGSGSLFNFTQTYSYSNNLMVSDNLIFNPDGESYNRTYTHNSDGSITENLTITNPGIDDVSYINKLYYLQGNLIKEEEFRINPDNPTPTLTSTTTYTYDNKNTPYKSVTGFLAIIPYTKNNVISEIKKNSSNIVTESIQYSYQYNSNDYPLDCIRVRTPYSTSSGITIPGTPTTTTEYFTYY